MTINLEDLQPSTADPIPFEVLRGLPLGGRSVASRARFTAGLASHRLGVMQQPPKPQEATRFPLLENLDGSSLAPGELYRRSELYRHSAFASPDTELKTSGGAARAALERGEVEMLIVVDEALSGAG